MHEPVQTSCGRYTQKVLVYQLFLHVVLIQPRKINDYRCSDALIVIGLIATEEALDHSNFRLPNSRSAV